MPDNTHERAAETANDRDGASELFEPLNKLNDLTRFWKTRNAILTEEPLFDYGKQRLEKEGHLGPWQFNLLQSTICGLPAIVLPLAVRVVKHLVGLPIPTDEPETLDKISEMVQTFSVPFILMLSAYVIGRASLWKGDRSRSSRTHAARAFLYLDGAYGFYPQLAVCTAFTLFLLAPEVPPIRSFWFWASIWQLYIYMKTIPVQLFHVVGYANADRVLSPNIPVTLFPPEDKTSRASTLSRPDPPLWKYRLSVLLVIPILSALVLAVITGISLALHALIVRLTG
ncbi:MAG TPA: hypothetical protein VM554_01315 [Acidisarcina sp.]|nr:hypothetical protein [Acidisarcina sp.]